MTVTVDSPLVGPPSGTMNAALDALGQQNAQYLTEMWRIATAVGLDPGIIAAQFHLETNGAQSPRWIQNRNPAGLAVESDSDPDPATWTQTDAARVHVWALATMTAAGNPENWPKGFTDHGFRSRWTMKMTDDNYPDPVRTVADLQKRYVDSTGEPQAVWAWDDQYAAKIVARHRAIFGAGGTFMNIVATECPIETYVNWTGPNRPGLAMPSPSKIVTHEVGNTSPGADEDMHRRFVLNGGGQFSVSFHFVVGPTKIVQLLNLDENAWHASDGYFGDGNRDAWGIEHIQIDDFNATLNHGAWLQAELARNPRRFAIKNPAAFVQDINPENVDERMVQHNWEAPDGKNCPQFIRERGLWTPYVNAVIKEIQSGTPAQPTVAPIWWEPGDIGPQQRESDGAWALAMLGEVTAKRNVPVRVSADSSSTVIETLNIGDKRKLVGTGKYRNRWNFIEVSPGVYGRALWSAFHERFPTL